MATFIDEGDEPLQNEEEYSSIEDEQVQDNLEQEPEPEDTEDDIPDKYKNKSVKDIVRMHQEAERAIGKQGSEVGELRRIVDDFVQAQTVSQKQQAPVTPFFVFVGVILPPLIYKQTRDKTYLST